MPPCSSSAGRCCEGATGDRNRRRGFLGWHGDGARNPPTARQLHHEGGHQRALRVVVAIQEARTEADVSDQDDWQAAQHADECEIQREIEEALERSKTRPLTEDERQLLAWAAGVQTHYTQENRA